MNKTAQGHKEVCKHALMCCVRVCAHVCSCACVLMRMGWCVMCGAPACSCTLQLYSVLPLAKLVNRQTWVAPDPRAVRKCTAFSGGDAVAVSLSSYWYTPSSLAERVNLATISPTFRGRYSKVHEPCRGEEQGE